MANEKDLHQLEGRVKILRETLGLPFYAGKPEYLEKVKAFLDDPKACAWDAIPFLRKGEIQEDQIVNPPFGSIIANHQLSLVRRTHRTSGTTGRPLFVCYSDEDVRAVAEVGAKAFRSAGVVNGDKVVHCLNYCMWAGGVTDHLSLEMAGANVIPFGVGNTHELIQVIKSLGVNGISCTPSYLFKLEEVLCKDFGIAPGELGLDYALCGGEGGLQDPGVRAPLEKRWGMRIVDANYGMAEVFSLFAGECRYRNGLHFFGDQVLYPEIINPSTGETLDLADEAQGELVLTNLQRTLQPLVRYRTGDVIRVMAGGSCACGEKGFRFQVVGRSDQMVVIRGINVFPGAIKSILSSYPEYFSGNFRMLLPEVGPVLRLNLQLEKCRNIALSDNIVVEMLCKDIAKVLHVKAEIRLVEEGFFPHTVGKTNYILRGAQ